MGAGGLLSMALVGWAAAMTCAAELTREKKGDRDEVSIGTPGVSDSLPGRPTEERFLFAEDLVDESEALEGSRWAWNRGLPSPSVGPIVPALGVRSNRPIADGDTDELRLSRSWDGGPWMRVVPSAEGSVKADSTRVQPVRLKPRVGVESDEIPASPAFPIPADAGVGVRFDDSRPLTIRLAGSATLTPPDKTASLRDGLAVASPPVSVKASPA
ncbi:MAG: hypothetical protein EBU81_11045, partial [Proteobacteria bacterium]|nr:hypothetical protein [Pseudomonadota bacterium]